MQSVKIIDTCTLINIFNSLDFDLSSCLEKYRTVITNHVVWEYTRKIPRQIPKCISVVGMSEEGRALVEETEYLLPRLGIGERSSFVLALEMASSDSSIVVLSDDRDAVKKFSDLAKNDLISSRFPGSDKIIWGDTMSLVGKFADEGRIPSSYLDRARRILGA